MVVLYFFKVHRVKQGQCFKCSAVAMSAVCLAVLGQSMALLAWPWIVRQWIAVTANLPQSQSLHTAVMVLIYASAKAWWAALSDWSIVEIFAINENCSLVWL